VIAEEARRMPVSVDEMVTHDEVVLERTVRHIAR
jgi:hypothetical protein